MDSAQRELILMDILLNKRTNFYTVIENSKDIPKKVIGTSHAIVKGEQIV